MRGEKKSAKQSQPVEEVAVASYITNLGSDTTVRKRYLADSQRASVNL